MNGKEKLRVKVTVDNLRSVFGDNWNTNVDGDIQQRVIGRININYRCSICVNNWVYGLLLVFVCACLYMCVGVCPFFTVRESVYVSSQFFCLMGCDI